MALRRFFVLLALGLGLSPTLALAAGYTWENVRIVAGGFIPGIEFSRVQAGLVYCRTDMGGAYRSDDSGQHWIPLTDWVGASNYNLMGIESIAPDPVDAKKVYLAAGMYAGGLAAMLRSSDQGAHFEKFAVPFRMGGNEDGRGVGERLAIDPRQTNILYFGTRHDGLWRSEDSAATWRRVETFPFQGAPGRPRKGTAGVSFVLFDPAEKSSDGPTKTILVGIADHAEANLFQSNDAGKTWTPVAGQPPPALMPRHAVWSAAGVVYLSYGNGAGPNDVTDGAVWKFDLRDGSWKNVSPALPNSPGERAYGYGGISLNRQHPGTVMVATLDRWGNDDVFRTIDGGKTWRGIHDRSQRDASMSPFLLWGNPSAALGWWIDALAIDPFDTSHVLYATGATVWGTHDLAALDHDQTTHWSVAANGIEQTAVIDLISPPAGAHLISGLGDVGGFVHQDFDVSPPQGMMKNPLLDNTDSLDFAEKNPAVIARVGRGKPGQQGGFSTDSGATWSVFATVPSASGSGKIAVSADGATFVWATADGGAYFSHDHGKTWTTCRGLPRGLRPIADRVNPEIFYAIDLSGGSLYSSQDRGEAFSSAKAQGMPAGDRRNFTLRAVPGREGDLWLCAAGALMRFDRESSRFVSLEIAGYVTTFGFGKAAPGQNFPAIYTAARRTDGEGIFRSDDGGKSWVQINDSQHQFGQLGPVIGDPRIYGRVYLGTNGRGVIYGTP